MQNIDVRGLAKGALWLTLGYFLFWLVGPLWLSEGARLWGLPVWFWCSCVAAPVLLSVVVACWLGGADHD